MNNLGANPTPDEVNKVLKDNSYHFIVPTEFMCEMCNTKHPELISFDSDPENETFGVMVCHKCLLSTFQLLEGG